MNEVNMEDIGVKIIEPVVVADLPGNSDVVKEAPSPRVSEPGGSFVSESSMKPDFLPDQYWVNGSVDLAKLVNDIKNYRLALSKHQQDIPSSEDGYDLKKLVCQVEWRIPMLNSRTD
jgi:hypothetical protein